MHVALVSAILGVVSGWVVKDEAAESAEVTAQHPVLKRDSDSAEEIRRFSSLNGARVLQLGDRVYGLEGWDQLSGAFSIDLRGSFGVGLGGGFDLSTAAEASMPPWADHGSYQALTLSVRHGLPMSFDDFPSFRAAVQVEAVGAHFGSKESAENLSDARHQTGYRDLNLGVAVPVSFGWSYYVKPEVFTTLDLQPASNGPLTGAPPRYTLGANFALEAGYELRLSRSLPLRIHTGIRMVVHGRRDDQTVTFATIVGFGFG